MRIGQRVSAALIFVAVFLIYFISPLRVSNDSVFVLPQSYSLLHGDGGALDDLLMAAPAHHAPMLTPSGQIHSMYPVGPALLAMPVMAALDLMVPDLRTSLHDRTVVLEVETLVASLIAALAASLMWLLARRVTARTGVALLTVAIFALASPMWSTASRGLWQHGPLVLLTLGAWLALWRADTASGSRRWLVLAGILCAGTVLMRPLAVSFVMVASIFVVVVHRRGAIAFLASGAAVAVAWLTFNWMTQGQLVSPYYLPGTFWVQRSAMWERVLGQLVSPSRGLLVFSPIFLIAFIGPILKWRSGSFNRHDALAIGATGSVLLLHLNSPAWWGGHSYGPRFMTDVVPFLAYLCIDPLERLAALGSSPTRIIMRGSVAVLFVISVAMHFNGAVNDSLNTWNQRPGSIGDPSQHYRLWDWRHPQFLQGPFRVPPYRLGEAVAHLWSPPGPPRAARLAVFFDPLPFRPDFAYRVRATPRLDVPVEWTLADLAGAQRRNFRVWAWADAHEARQLSIQVGTREVARWSVVPDGRRQVLEIGLPVGLNESDNPTEPLRVVADDQPGLLKVAILRTNDEIDVNGAPPVAPPTVAITPTHLGGYVDRVDCGTVNGWVLDFDRPTQPVVVEIYAGDKLAGSVRAGQFRQGLLDGRIGPGTHGFSFPLPEDVKDGKNHTIKVRVQGTSYEVEFFATTPRFISCRP